MEFTVLAPMTIEPSPQMPMNKQFTVDVNIIIWSTKLPLGLVQFSMCKVRMTSLDSWNLAKEA